jgi:beta-lactamase class A
MIEILGFEAIAKTLRSDKYRLYNKQKGGGLWVGKKYAASGKKNPDPLKGLSHAATADQVARFYTMLAYGKLVNPEVSEEMMEYMGNPELHHKFVNSLDKLSNDIDIYRKSESWRNFHSDSALVYGDDGRKYILVALIEDPAGGQICKQLVYSAERVLGINKNAPLAANQKKTKISSKSKKKI